MKVSIITVCHNQIYHTQRFVNSLKRFTPQEPHQWELIIIDSGSTDGTFEMYQEQFKTIQSAENIGWIKGINEGLDWVADDTDIVIFANNDVVLDSVGWLERLLKHFDNPTVGAVGPVSNYVMGMQNTSNNQPHVTEQDTLFLVGFFMAVRMDIVEHIGRLEENLADYVPDIPEDQRAKLRLGGADDLDYSVRISQAGWKLVIARDVFVWHSGSRTFLEVVGKDGYNAQWQAADLAFERKWGPGSRAALTAIPTKYAIALPMRGNHPNWLFSKSLITLIKPPEWFTIESRRSVVDQSRNKIVETAIQRGIDYILFLDDDHTFPSDTFMRLIGHKKDVVGCLCFRRQEPFGPCVFKWQTHPENGNLMVWEMPEIIGKGLQKVDAIGFGAVLVKTEVFKRLGPAPWFKFDEVGEDLFFCDLCARAGIDIWCDTDLVAPHINDDGIQVDAQVYWAHCQHRMKAVGVA